MVALKPAEWVAIGDGVPAEAGAIFWVTYKDAVTGERFVALCVRMKQGISLVYNHCRTDGVFKPGAHFMTHWRKFPAMFPTPAGGSA